MTDAEIIASGGRIVNGVQQMPATQTPVVTGGANVTPITTNINDQKALTQNDLDRQKAVKDTQQSYILNKAQYDTNK